MPRKPPSARQAAPSSPRRPSSLLDTRVIYCGDNLDQLKKLPAACVDLIYIDPPAWPKPLHRGEGPPFNSNRNDEVFWGERSEPRAQASGFLPAFEDRHASTQAYIEYMRPRCVELARVLNKSGSLYCSDAAQMMGELRFLQYHRARLLEFRTHQIRCVGTVLSLRLAREPPVARLGSPVPPAQ